MNRTKLLVLRVTAGAGAALLAMTGYAYAGGDLPDLAETAVETVLQVDLPDDHEVSEGKGGRSQDVKDAKAAFGDERGCEFGQAVSAAASGKTDKEKDPCTEMNHGKSDAAHAKAKGQTKEKSNNGKSDAAHAKAKGQTKEKSNNGKSDAAQAKAKEKSNNGRSETAPKGSKATGEEKSETES